MIFKYLGKTKVNCLELIMDYMPNYEPDVKKEAFEGALEKHRHYGGEIEISRVIGDKTLMSFEIYRKRSFKLTLDTDYYDYAKLIKVLSPITRLISISPP